LYNIWQYCYFLKNRNRGYHHNWHHFVGIPRTRTLLQLGSGEEHREEDDHSELMTRENEHIPLEEAMQVALSTGATRMVPRYDPPGGVPGAQSLLDLYAEGVRMPGYGASPMEVEAAHDEAEARRRVLADADGASHLAAALSTSGRSM